jgi:hypothetical protein
VASNTLFYSLMTTPGRPEIYFLKAKDEVFDRFQEFRALVENQTGRKIWVLRSDNGGEYTSKEFVDYCATAGSRRNSQFLTILNKMEWPRGRTGP